MSRILLSALVFVLACNANPTTPSLIVEPGDPATPGPDAAGIDAGRSTPDPDPGPTDAGSVTEDASPPAPDAAASDSGTGDAGEDASTPIDSGVDSGVDSGIIDCEDPDRGITRPVAWECSACRPPGAGVSWGGGVCEVDDDCSAGVNGRCMPSRIGGSCSYDECFTDGDCEDDELCACDGGYLGGNSCIEAGCHTNADCPTGHSCSPSLGFCGNYFPAVGYYCHTDTDECTVDSDCIGGGGGFGGGYCMYQSDLGHWTCSYSHCAG